MSCSPLKGAPELGQVLSPDRAPPGWEVLRTGVGFASHPLASPVWRVVRIQRAAGGWRVAVAPFRA